MPRTSCPECEGAGFHYVRDGMLVFERTCWRCRGAGMLLPLAKEKNMDLKIDGEKLEELLTTAVLQALSPLAQTELVKQVVQHLITKPPSYYSNGAGRTVQPPSPLIDMMQRAANRVAEQVVAERIHNDESFKAELDKLLMEAWQQITVADRQKTVEKIARGMLDALSADR